MGKRTKVWELVGATHTAKVHRDVEWGIWRATVVRNGTTMPTATNEQDTLVDAIGTARTMLEWAEMREGILANTAKG
jgi:hypothetical protein